MSESKLGSSFTSKEVILLIISIAAMVIISILFNPSFLQNTDLTVTIFEWKSHTSNIERDPGVQVLIQNTGTISLHDIRVVFNTNSMYRIEKVVHAEFIQYTVEPYDKPLVIKVPKLSPNAFFIVNVAGEANPDFNRSLIVSSEEGDLIIVNFPYHIHGGISTKTFSQPWFLLIFAIGIPAIIFARYLGVRRHENIRKFHFSYNLKHQQVDSRIFWSSFYIFLVAIVGIMIYQNSVQPMPIQNYTANTFFELQPNVDITSFLVGYPPLQFPGDFISFVLSLSILIVIIIVNIPSSRQRRTWTHESDVSVKDISGSYVNHQSVKLSDSYQIVESRAEIVLISNQKNDLITIVTEDELGSLHIRKNTTFQQILDQENPTRPFVSFYYRFSDYLDKKIFGRGVPKDELFKEISLRKFNFLMIKPDMKIQDAIKSLKDSSKRFAIIKTNDEIILGVLDYSLLV